MRIRCAQRIFLIMTHFAPRMVPPTLSDGLRGPNAGRRNAPRGLNTRARQPLAGDRRNYRGAGEDPRTQSRFRGVAPAREFLL